MAKISSYYSPLFSVKYNNAGQHIRVIVRNLYEMIKNLVKKLLCVIMEKKKRVLEV